MGGGEPPDGRAGQGEQSVRRAQSAAGPLQAVQRHKVRQQRPDRRGEQGVARALEQGREHEGGDAALGDRHDQRGAQGERP